MKLELRLSVVINCAKKTHRTGEDTEMTRGCVKTQTGQLKGRMKIIRSRQCLVTAGQRQFMSQSRHKLQLFLFFFFPFYYRAVQRQMIIMNRNGCQTLRTGSECNFLNEGVNLTRRLLLESLIQMCCFDWSGPRTRQKVSAGDLPRCRPGRRSPPRAPRSY